MKTVQKNRWKLPIIVGSTFLAIIIILAVIVLVLNGGEKKQVGFNKTNNVFNELKTSIQYPQQSCHLQGGNGRILVDFHNKGLCSHKRTNACRDFWWQNANIPAGKYKVYLESYDGYGPSPGKNDGREHSNPQDQKYEQYYVEFYKGNTKVATSGTTPDLQDNVREARFSGIVNNELNISQNTTKLLIKHKVPYPNKPNSLRAICMMLEPIPQPINGQCGSITLTKILYDSAPTENLCAKGTATSVTESSDSNGRVWSWRCKGSNGGSDSGVCKVYGKPLPVCGDGKVNQDSENCDRGTAENGQACTPEYGKTCTYCDSNCHQQTVVGPRCGDGHVNGNEECDEGDSSNGHVPSVGYGETKHYCKSDCTMGTVVGGQCGNGTVEGDEECDLGEADNGKVCTPEYGKTCTYCDSNCQEQTVAGGDCGNGTKEGDEKCDDGNNNGKIPVVAYGKTKHYCKTDCTIGTVVGGQCGDGKLEGDEECDDGNVVNGDGCSATCQKEKKQQKEEKSDCNSSIGNYIWYDTNGNGIQEDIEEGIEGIKVCAYRGNKKYCDVTSKSGKYKIKNLCEGTYKVVVKGVGAMVQTFDPDGKKDNKTKVRLKNNDKHTKADFGYRGKAPSTGLATNIALLIGLSTLITIGILLIMRKKGAL